MVNTADVMGTRTVVSAPTFLPGLWTQVGGVVLPVFGSFHFRDLLWRISHKKCLSKHTQLQTLDSTLVARNADCALAASRTAESSLSLQGASRSQVRSVPAS